MTARWRRRPSRRGPGHAEGQQGQVVVLFALVMVVLLGASALVIDVGLLRNDRARLQDALDAGTLAAVQSMPANAGTISSVAATATRFVQKNYPGVTPAITYRCLIGVDAAGLPRMTDMPSACNVSFAAGSTQWRCTATACWAPCDPLTVATDVCNSIQLSADATRTFGFGSAIGVGAGGVSVGDPTSAACNGLCGASPTAPLDLVIVADRTSSMAGAFPDSTATASLRAGARAVLGAYDPAIQRVAFGTLGPSSIYSQSAGNSANAIACLGTPAVNTAAMDIVSPSITAGATTSATNASRAITRLGATNAATGTSATSLSVTMPSNSAGTSNLLVASVAVTGVGSVTTPTGWTLITSTANGTSLTTASFYRWAPTTSTSYTFSWTGSHQAVVGLVAYSGVNTTTPIDAKPAGSTGSNKNVAPGNITTTGPSEMIVGFYGSATSTNFSPATNMAEAVDKSSSAGPTLEMADMVAAAAGVNNNLTATAGNAGAWATHLVALNPALQSGTSLTMATPATAAGDVVVAAISIAGGSGSTLTAPSGWTSIRRSDNGTAVSVAAWYHVVTGSEPASYTWTTSGAAATGTLSAYGSVDPSSVLDPSASAGSGGTGTSGTASTSVRSGTVTTTTDGALVVGAFASSAGTTFTKPTAMTERADVAFNGATGPTVELADVTQATAATTGTYTATSAASATWATVLFALRAKPVDVYSIDPNNADAVRSWIPVGFSGLDTDSPSITSAGARGHAEAYSAGGVYVAGSSIGQAINCFDQSGTGTNLATPIDMAVKYLQTYGRSGARKGIILETDGQPSAASACAAGTLDATACAKFTSAAAQASADAAKAAGISLFTIGYGGSTGGIDAVLLGNMASVKAGSSTCTSAENLDGDTFFCAPTAADLTGVFASAAAALAAGPHLVQLYPQPVIASVSPAGGSKAGGSVVTVTGSGFTDVFAVAVGGAGATFSVTSDTTMTVRIPAAAATGVVDVTATSPGGTSKVTTGDRFTYIP